MRGLILSSGLLLAALVAGPQAAVAQAGGGKAFCLQSASGSMNCAYDTLAQCEQRRGGQQAAGGCVPNPAARSGTTGAGGGAREPSAPQTPPGGGQYLPPPSQSR